MEARERHTWHKQQGSGLDLEFPLAIIIAEESHALEGWHEWGEAHVADVQPQGIGRTLAPCIALGLCPRVLVDRRPELHHNPSILQELAIRLPTHIELRLEGPEECVSKSIELDPILRTQSDPDSCARWLGEPTCVRSSPRRVV